MAHAPGRGMAPFCRHRTIPGCPDAYRQCSARSNPRLMRGAPSRRTAAAARPRPCEGSIGGTVEAARRTLLVWAARRASGEDRALRSIVCRHRDGRESSGEDELTPRGVRVPTPSSGSERSGGVWRPARPDAAWRQFVLIGRFPAVLMPTSDAPQGHILTRCAACRRNEQRPSRGLDRARGLDRGRILRRDFDKMKPSASVHAPPTPHTTHLTQPPDSTRSGSGYEAQASMQWPHTASEPPRARRRRGHLYPVLLRASALLRCGHSRTSHERPGQPHGQ